MSHNTVLSFLLQKRETPPPLFFHLGQSTLCLSVLLDRPIGFQNGGKVGVGHENTREKKEESGEEPLTARCEVEGKKKDIFLLKINV